MSYGAGGLRLRPMNVGDLLDETFALYRQNFSLFAGIVAVLAVPETILTTLITIGRPANAGFTRTAGGTVNFDAGSFWGYLALIGLALLVSLIFSQLITGALAQAISARYLGRSTTVGGAYASVGVRTYVVLLLSLLLESLILIPASLLFVIPGIYLVVSFLFVAQVVVLERTGPWGGLTRSRRLVRGSWWRVFGIGLLVFIIVGILEGIVNGVLLGLVTFAHPSAHERDIIAAVLGAAVSIFVTPIQLGALTLLYYDLRIRKEGFDLELAAASLGDPQRA